jgi:hypothetical protein
VFVYLDNEWAMGSIFISFLVLLVLALDLEICIRQQNIVSNIKNNVYITISTRNKEFIFMCVMCYMWNGGDMEDWLWACLG